MSSLLAYVLAAPAQAQTDPSLSTGPAQGVTVAVSTPAASLPGIVPSTPSVYSLPIEPAPVPARPRVLGEIALQGNKNVKFRTVKGQIKAKKGNLYDRPDLDKDIQSLLGLGNFERVAADIASTGLPVPANYAQAAGSSTTMKLTFVVSERPLVKKIVWKGQKKLSRSVLADLIALKTKDPLDTVKLREDEVKILGKYNETGFLDAEVRSEVATDTGTLQSTVTFIIEEGAKSKITWVRLNGVSEFRTKELLKEVKNKRKKVFVEKELREDQRKIETHYLNHGYLDVVVSSPAVMYSVDKERIYIDYDVKEGRQYRYGDTTFSGYTVYTASELVKTIEYRKGKIFNQEKFEDTIRGIQEIYAEQGRLRARVSPVKTHNPATDLMDVHYAIVEGNPVYVEHIDVEGNRATKKHVIAREIVIKPGDMFKASRVRKSREKIMNLGFMDDVEIDIQSPSDPEKVDLTFDVVEGKPGVLTAGAAYSSLDGLIGTLSLQHMNLFGRAQKGSIQWSFGRRVQDYSLSWTTPWIGKSPTSFGTDLFNTRRVNPFQSSSSAYVEKNRGGRLRLGPRFQEDKYHLDFSYTFSQITVTDVEQQFQGQLSEGTSNFSSLTAEFARDTRDNIWDPTRGSRHSLSLSLSGGPLQGNIHYIKPSISNSIHFHLASIADYPLVLTVANRAAYITQFGTTKEVPVFARFYLGGQDTLRGYAPTGEVGYPYGGKLMDVMNIELGFPLARERKRTIVKVVGFFDMGTTWDRVKDISGRIGSGERDIKTNAGVGIRFTTPAFPIRLDWGYGFNHRKGERLYQINFGLGNLF